jgi:hypothetical protein
VQGEEPTILEYAQLVAASLDRIGVEYAFGGAIAVNTWVLREAIRATHDIDLHAEVSGDELLVLCMLLGKHGVSAVQGGEVEFRRSGTVLRRVHCMPEMVIDFLVRGDEYGRAVLARRRRIELRGATTYVISPEDVLIQKALAFRDRDRIDIEHIVEAHGPDLDRAYLERWTRRLRVWTRLARRLSRRASGGGRGG